MNDNSKKATAQEITRLADAIFNKISAISGTADRETQVRLMGELGGIVTRAQNAGACRSRDANALLAKAVARARETTRRMCA